MLLHLQLALHSHTLTGDRGAGAPLRAWEQRRNDNYDKEKDLNKWGQLRRGSLNQGTPANAGAGATGANHANSSHDTTATTTASAHPGAGAPPGGFPQRDPPVERDW
jgi:hypothetical protein